MPADRHLGLDRPAAGRRRRRRAAVLAPGQPAGGDLRRDVLRQGRAGRCCNSATSGSQAAKDGRRPPTRRSSPRPEGIPHRTTPAYVVHPPVGKWVIGLGEQMFGLTPFGWRFMVALLGTLVGADAVPDRAPAVPLDAAGLRRGPAARRRRPALRDEPDRAARPRSSCSSCWPRSAACCSTATGHGPGSPRAAGRRDGDRRADRSRPAGSGGGRGGSRPACAWAWPSRDEVERPVLPRRVRRHGRAVGRRRAPGVGGRPPAVAVAWSATRAVPAGVLVLVLAARRLRRVVDRAGSCRRPTRLRPQLGADHAPAAPGLACRLPTAQPVALPPRGVRLPQRPATPRTTYQSNPWSWLVLARPVSYFYESPNRQHGCPERPAAPARSPRWAPRCCGGRPASRWSTAALPLGRRAATGGPARSCAGVAAGLPAVVRLPAPHDLLLLRRGVRAVPVPGRHAVPGPGHRRARRVAAAPPVGGRGRRTSCSRWRTSYGCSLCCPPR